MASLTSAESKALLRMLDDGEWHPFKEISEKLAATVAPGKALRRYDARVANQMLHGRQRKSADVSEAEKILSGQRTIANGIINTLKRRFIEIKDDGDQRLVRRRDEVKAINKQPPTVVFDDEEPDEEPRSAAGYTCPQCGLWVVNHVQHEEFHDLVEPAATAPFALLTADEVRGVVRDEIENALDDFQVGMQNFLLERLNALETDIAGWLDAYEVGAG